MACYVFICLSSIFCFTDNLCRWLKKPSQPFSFYVDSNWGSISFRFSSYFEVIVIHLQMFLDDVFLFPIFYSFKKYFLLFLHNLINCIISFLILSFSNLSICYLFSKFLFRRFAFFSLHKSNLFLGLNFVFLFTCVIDDQQASKRVLGKLSRREEIESRFKFPIILLN